VNTLRNAYRASPQAQEQVQEQIAARDEAEEAAGHGARRFGPKIESIPTNISMSWLPADPDWESPPLAEWYAGAQLALDDPLQAWPPGYELEWEHAYIRMTEDQCVELTRPEFLLFGTLELLKAGLSLRAAPGNLDVAVIEARLRLLGLWISNATERITDTRGPCLHAGSQRLLAFIEMQDKKEKIWDLLPELEGLAVAVLLSPPRPERRR
jgi:hypothetical protein